MNNKKYNWILYLITATILTTIAVQLYWNYKNYEQNKQRVLNEIQQSLDDSVETYFAELSKSNMMTIVEEEGSLRSNKRKNIFNKIFNVQSEDKKDTSRITVESIEFTTRTKEDFEKTKSQLIDSAINITTRSLHSNFKDSIPKGYAKINRVAQLSDDKKIGLTFDAKKGKISSVQVFRGKKAADSLKLIKGLETIFIALESDTLKYNQVDSILSSKLNQKNIKINYAFEHYKKDTLFSEFNPSPNVQKKYSALSKSTYFAGKQNLKLNYTNPTLDTLKRSSTGILLSLLLSLAIISSLFYLLKIINQQKQLAAIKNDLISNITHEFKTPIATVSTAVEALENFNAVNDTEKTKKYLNISSVQLKKLHGMVEKLLETATLDSEKLLLNKEAIDIVGFTEKIVNKHKLIAPEKNIQFFTNTRELFIGIDNFHLENAVSNLIDNAVKYGGNDIDIAVTTVLKTVEITVADNGKGIDKSQQEKIFDKFYRVPKGNVHDVKGFGIGLYYTKKIVEKHNGTIQLTSKPKSTVFKVTLPNE